MSSTQKQAADTQEDRRDNTAPRRRYEALVEVGSASVGGFEAESVDLCLDGMRLRTAYMPKPGEELVCRFDGHGGEIVARGEVVWTDRNGRAGEFGLRFVGLDRKGMKLLEDICDAEPEPEPEPEPVPEPEPEPLATPGSRVRLHITGLGSPMRARVRDSAVEEVLVGSNLEFLKVGRTLDLEDVEQGRRRQATIEHVGVDIDPETHVPQLVVALSYADEDLDLTTAPIRVKKKVVRAAEPKEEIVEETTPEPTVIDNEPTPSLGRASVSEVPAERVARMPAPAPAAVEASDELDDEEDEDLHGYRAQGADDEEDEEEAIEAAAAPAGWLRAASAFADRLKPTLTTAQSGARSAVGKVAAAVQQRRAKPAGPKRTTAPPPGGALRTQGRRVVRDPKGRLRRQHREEAEVEEKGTAPKGDKRRALFSGVLGVMAVFAIYFASQKIKGGGDETPNADPATATSAAPEVPGGAPAPEMGVAPGQNPVATADVPLFGATPLSTTEAVPVPPQFAKPGELPAEEPADDAEGAPAEPAKTFGALETEWGVGEITNPTVLRLKMDGNVEGIVGKETATGFTVVVPGRKSVSNAAGLARKDKRLTSVNVVNYPDRAEITLRFRKDVPAFLAKVQGKRLIIHISTPDKKRRR